MNSESKEQISHLLKDFEIRVADLFPDINEVKRLLGSSSYEEITYFLLGVCKIFSDGAVNINKTIMDFIASGGKLNKNLDDVSNGS